jgi:hypothetical protein
LAKTDREEAMLSPALAAPSGLVAGQGVFWNEIPLVVAPTTNILELAVSPNVVGVYSLKYSLLRFLARV